VSRRRALVVVIALAGLCVSFAVLHAAHRRARRDALPATGAYRYGGEPDRDPELEDLLGEQLAELAVATDQARHGRSESERDRTWMTKQLRVAWPIARRGPWLVAAWHGFLDAMERWSDAPLGSRGYRTAEHELRSAARDVSDQLAALGLAYYVDTAAFVDHGRAHAVTFAYRVEHVVFVHAGDERRRILELRRLDRLNAERSLLGMQSELLGDPVVLLDQVEDYVSGRLAPVIAGGGYELGGDSASVVRLGRAAGAAVRRELAASGEPVADLVVASVRRHEARHGWDRDRDEPLRMPERLGALIGSNHDDVFAQRARAELTAYTSQIAGDPRVPQIALWNLASQAFHRERWGSPESYVAVVVLEGLARHVGAVPLLPSVRRGQLDRQQLAELTLPLADLTDEELRIAARALWVELYDEPLLPIE
jgi:hypothetical protein